MVWMRAQTVRGPTPVNVIGKIYMSFVNTDTRISMYRNSEYDDIHITALDVYYSNESLFQMSCTLEKLVYYRKCFSLGLNSENVSHK
jgi:hypothetical protein